MDFKTHELPLARIKKIMRSEEEVRDQRRLGCDRCRVPSPLKKGVRNVCARWSREVRNL
jgi:hypothetical protein